MNFYYFLCYFLLFLIFSPALDAQSPVRNGKDYAVFIYNTHFDHSVTWGNLPETENEAKDLANELQSNFNFQVKLYANLSKKEILGVIRQWNERVQPDDQILFFLSSHGYYDAGQDEGFWIPRDGEGEDNYGESWLSYGELGRYLARSKSKHVLLALDACYSGAFGIRYKNGRPDKLPWDKNNCATKIKRALLYKSRLYFSSGSELDPTPSKSQFAVAWLTALRKLPENGIVRTNELQYHIKDLVETSPMNGSFTGHEPGGDFVFVHKDACRKEPPSNNQTDPDTNINDQVEYERCTECLPIDPEGKRYQSLQVGSKWWMNQNHNFQNARLVECRDCETYGRLYTWKDAKEACARLGDGWRLPYLEDWQDLSMELGEGYADTRFGGAKEGDHKKSFKTISESHWQMQLAGQLSGRKMEDQGKEAFYWTSTPADNGKAYFFNLSKLGVFQDIGDPNLKMSCRCVRDGY